MSPPALDLRPLDRDSGIALYLQLEQSLQEAIRDRRMGPGDALPSERRLAAELGVSRLTVRRALQGLLAGGWVVSHPGAGHFVATSPDFD